MKTLAIYCAGGLGKEIYDLAERSKKYAKIFFVDDAIIDKTFYKAEVRKIESIKPSTDLEFAIANGEPFVRQMLQQKVEQMGFKLATIVDATAIVSKTAELDNGVLVNANCFVSSNVVIGKNTYLQQLCTLGHDAEVGANSVISSLVQVSGGCKIADVVYVGAGSVVREKVSVGFGSVVGMGSFVHKDVKELAVVYGNPAKFIRDNKSQRVFNKKQNVCEVVK